LNRKDTTFEDTKTFSKAVAGIMQKHHPDLVTAKMAKQERKAKVFINWSQNDASKTMICVYSLRAREKPFVSFPLEWRDLEYLAKLGDPEKMQVIHLEAVRRVKEKGDLFRDVLIKEQKLPHL
jgi:bifunctional non-homologous end joining protein LigD